MRAADADAAQAPSTGDRAAHGQTSRAQSLQNCVGGCEQQAGRLQGVGAEHGVDRLKLKACRGVSAERRVAQSPWERLQLGAAGHCHRVSGVMFEACKRVGHVQGDGAIERSTV
eukprot:350715-Chlamydomonas_euryale.AAC.6